MDLKNWYASNFESVLLGRYITLEQIFPLLKKYQNTFDISIVGTSELGKEIHLIKLGYGPKIVLGWSQMHGNETTTTKAIFDFIKFIGQNKYFKSEIEQFLSSFTFYIIPILNPDGAQLYTRENANMVDLNRDAQKLSQAESVVLRNVFNEVRPDLCLNLHDQRSIFGLRNDLPATLSFLAPAGDPSRKVTKTRKLAMNSIVRMYNALQPELSGQIGRYDDTFNLNCVGDTFENEGVPTILFEAGHYQEDYQREKTREFVFYSYLELFEIGGSRDQKTVFYKDYFKIPENRKNFRDIVLKNVRIGNSTICSLAFQYKEVLINDKISFVLIFDSILKEEESIKGHKELIGHDELILINSKNSIEVGEEVFSIIGQNKESKRYFPFI